MRMYTRKSLPNGNASAYRKIIQASLNGMGMAGMDRASITRVENVALVAWTYFPDGLIPLRPGDIRLHAASLATGRNVQGS